MAVFLDYATNINSNYLVPSLNYLNSQMTWLREIVEKHTHMRISKTKLAGITILTITVYYCGKIWYTHRFFQRRGVKTPHDIRFISGNHHEIVKNGYSEQLSEWTRRYGKTYGFYEGHLPILVTSDLDFMQEIFIKQFSNFTGRKMPPPLSSDESPQMNLFFASRDRWRRMRTIMNPTFSPVKLKELMPLVKMCTSRLFTNLDKRIDQEINISEFLSCFTMDTICNCAFGLDFDIVNNQTDPFFLNAKGFFDFLSSYQGGILFALYFHELKPLVISIGTFISFITDKLGSITNRFSNPIFWIIRHINQIMEKRYKTGIKRRDYMQILLDSQTESTEIISTDKKMTLNEIAMNLVLFMVAGYDTTSSTMSYCLHVLANHPSEMEKLQNEIDAKFTLTENFQAEYEELMDLSYLDMFIKEVLRMYPLTVNPLNRRCTKECTVNGIDLCLDQIIAVDVLSCHYDPEIWGPTDPNVFYPERFLPEIKRHPCAYVPFGMGPRTCIGMKFAMIEIKTILVNLLLRYNIVRTPNTVSKLEFKEGAGVRRPKQGIFIKLVKRAPRN